MFVLGVGFAGGGIRGRLDAEGFVEAIEDGRDKEGEDEDGPASFPGPALRFLKLS